MKGKPKSLIALEAKAASDPSNAASIHALADTYADLGHWDDAIKTYRAAIALDASDADLYNSLGTVYEEAGDLEEAEEAYQQALAIDSRHSMAYYNLGALCVEQQRTTEAIQMLGRCLRCTTGAKELSEIRWDLKQLLNVKRIKQPTWVMGRRRVFQRSAATAQARILDRWEKRDYSGGGGGGGGTILDLIVPLVLLLSPSYIYYVVVLFDAVRADSTVVLIALEAEVSKGFYGRHPPGTTVTVRYSMEDPIIAVLEDEERV